MYKLRWLVKKPAIVDDVFVSNAKERVLQYSFIVDAQFGDKGEISETWSEWQDVPEVDE